MREPENLADLQQGVFADVPDVGRIVFGVGEARAYAMAAEGLIPGVVRQGRRLRVHVPKMLAGLDAVESA